MEKFIPYEKLSKKEKQKQNAARRGSWHGLNPVTRKPRDPKAYNRKKAQKWKDDSGSVPFVFLPAPGRGEKQSYFAGADGLYPEGLTASRASSGEGEAEGAFCGSPSSSQTS